MGGKPGDGHHWRRAEIGDSHRPGLLNLGTVTGQVFLPARSSELGDSHRPSPKGDQVDSIKSAVSELEQAQQALSKMMYEAEKNKPADAPTGAPAGAPAEDEAIDAEFEVKKD
ncbi:MAG: hypothetical protein Q8M16_00490 [Pirellulaceae bacterium]|nr:hypothetical protein [Pirellulaceae bacterium]